jgi:hypothetical protein
VGGSHPNRFERFTASTALSGSTFFKPPALPEVADSSKSDALPDLDLYLPRLAKLHFAAIESAKTRPKLLEDYIDCFKRSPSELLALGEVGLFALYREVMLPQSQIAMNQGFEFGWKLRL